MLAALGARWQGTIYQNRFPSRRALEFYSLQNFTAVQVVFILRARHPAAQQAQRHSHYQREPNQKVDALHGGPFQKPTHTNI